MKSPRLREYLAKNNNLGMRRLYRVVRRNDYAITKELRVIFKPEFLGINRTILSGIIAGIIAGIILVIFA